MNAAAMWVRRLGDCDDAVVRHRIREADRLRTAGRVISTRAVTGRIEGRVQGGHARPHVAELLAPEWTAEQWRAVGEVLSQQARHYARLLAGLLPEQFDRVLDALDLSLVPQPTEWRLQCTCTTPAPCLHQVAVWLEVRTQLDDDPYLLARVRGRSREELLAEIRAQRAGDDRDRLELADVSVPRWAHPDMSPWDIPLPTPRTPRTAAGPLRMLGDPPSWAGPTSPAVLFGPAVSAAAQRASALLRGEAADADG